TIARYGRNLLPGADRRRAALYEPFLALAPDVGHVPPGEIGGRDAPEHGASVEPIETVAERVPPAPHRERGFRLAARHQVAGKEGETLAMANDAVDVKECDARCHLRSPTRGTFSRLRPLKVIGRRDFIASKRQGQTVTH